MKQMNGHKGTGAQDPGRHPQTQFIDHTFKCTSLFYLLPIKEDCVTLPELLVSQRHPETTFFGVSEHIQ